MTNSPKLWTKVPKNTASSKRRLNSQDRVRSEIWKLVKRIVYKGHKGETLKARRAFSYWPEAEGREKIEGLETKTKYLKSPPHDTDLPILIKKSRYWWMHESCWVEGNFKDTTASCIIKAMLNVHNQRLSDSNLQERFQEMLHVWCNCLEANRTLLSHPNPKVFQYPNPNMFAGPKSDRAYKNSASSNSNPLHLMNS